MDVLNETAALLVSLGFVHTSATCLVDPGETYGIAPYGGGPTAGTGGAAGTGGTAGDGQAWAAMDRTQGVGE